MQRKHMEPQRQGKQTLLGKPKDFESCKLHEDYPKGQLNCTRNYNANNGDEPGREGLTDGEDWGKLQERISVA